MLFIFYRWTFQDYVRNFCFEVSKWIQEPHKSFTYSDPGKSLWIFNLYLQQIILDTMWRHDSEEVRSWCPCTQDQLYSHCPMGAYLEVVDLYTPEETRLQKSVFLSVHVIWNEGSCMLLSVNYVLWINYGKKATMTVDFITIKSVLSKKEENN